MDWERYSQGKSLLLVGGLVHGADRGIPWNGLDNLHMEEREPDCHVFWLGSSPVLAAPYDGSAEGCMSGHLWPEVVLAVDAMQAGHDRSSRRHSAGLLEGHSRYVEDMQHGMILEMQKSRYPEDEADSVLAVCNLSGLAMDREKYPACFGVRVLQTTKAASGKTVWVPKDEATLRMVVVDDHTEGARRNGSYVGHDGKGSCDLSPARGLQLRTWLLIKPSSVSQQRSCNIGARTKCEANRLPEPLSPTLALIHDAEQQRQVGNQ